MTITSLLGGSWVVISRVISRISIVITHIRGLMTPLITNREPPSSQRKQQEAVSGVAPCSRPDISKADARLARRFLRQEERNPKPYRWQEKPTFSGFLIMVAMYNFLKRSVLGATSRL